MEAARQDIARIWERVKQRRQDYISYDFSRKKNDMLKTFFDLAQEFDTLKDYYRICVTIPLDFMGLDSRLYLLNEEDRHLELVCDSLKGLSSAPLPTAPEYVIIANQPYEVNDSYIVPVIGKPAATAESKRGQAHRRIIGMFELFPVFKLTEEDRFFFTKYTNRIGYNLHNKKIARQNVRHLKFINNLVRDIEHNVIIPNMHFKHLFNQLRKKINEMEVLQQEAVGLKDDHAKTHDACDRMVDRISLLQQGLAECNHELQKHHVNLSLFLESLFRRDHFEKGRIVLRPQRCRVEDEIIVPQLDHYLGRLKSRDIQVVRPHDMQAEVVTLMVDIGLLAQVYANLFSNAVKYADAVDVPGRGMIKYVTYGREFIPDCFGGRAHGIKFNVFTTGRHLDESDRQSVFLDGFRGENTSNIEGKGHGLAFIKYVIEMHAGKVGYEATPYGNNFYFILPLPAKEDFQ